MKILPRYWIIVLLLLIVTSLSFLDRQVLSITIIKIKEDLFISDVDYGFINSGFLASYAIMFTLGGILIDKYGSRMGLAFSVGFWSLATMLHSLAGSIMHLTLFRFMLGAGEGGCFPGAIKAVIEWVPKKKRALASGIAIGGAAFGAVVAPPLCGYMLGFWGWKMIFIVTGGFGFVWLIFWLLATRKKSESSARTQADEKVIQVPKYNFIKTLKSKEAMVFMVMRFLLDPILYFYMFWIPKYLNEEHQMGVEFIGQVLWIPFLALGIANIGGGWFSDLIFIRTQKTRESRLIVMGLAALLTLPVIFIGSMGSYVIILFVMGLAFFAHGLWITNYITSIADVFGKSATSTVVGLSGTAGALSSLVLNPIIGYVISTWSYNPLWVYAGVMYPVVFIGFMLFMLPGKVRLGVGV